MAELFGKSPRHNAIVLFALSGMDVVSTYLCIVSGLQEANPLIRMFYGLGLFYDSTVPGLLMHLILYWLIALFIAYAAQYFRGKNDLLTHAILLGYAAMLCVVAFNNLFLLTGILIRGK
jgi:hypothetical protein